MFSKSLLYIFLLIYHVKCLESDDLRKKESGYMLIHPKSLIAGRNESFCLSLHDVSLPTKIIVDMKIDNYHEIINTVLQIEHTCFKLFINPEKVKYSQYGSLHFQIQLNGTIYSSFNTDPIFIIANDKLTFIETDKTTYKPGDVVKFRILMLDNYMRPVINNKISSVKIINPNGNVVMIWENISTNLGLLQLEHQLNDNTLLGKWKIEVNGNKLRSFIVKRYVLPRYKVTLIYPKLIHTSSKNVEIKLCAKYSYGRPVKGNALIKISNPVLLKEPITKYQPITNDCVKFVLTQNEITLKENFKLNIVGMVTESETSHVEVHTGKIDITNKPYDFEFSNENVYFQPGIPYYGKLNIYNKIIDIENNEIIEICYHVAVKNKWNLKRKIHCSNFTIDSNTDSIHFSLYPFKASIVQVHLKARTAYSRINMDENIQTFIINRWYSPSASFIYLNHTKTINRCRSTQHLTVYYTSDRIKKNDLVTFYYMIQSKDDVVRFGKILHNSRKQENNNSMILMNVIGERDRFTKLSTEIDKFSFKFKLDNRIISNVQFLIYFVTIDGEIVSSSSKINMEKCLLHSVKATWSNANIAPGDMATINIKASPNSICSISSVDKVISYMDNFKLLNTQLLLNRHEQERVPKPNYKLCQPHSKRKAAAENLEEMKIVDTYLDLRRRRRSYVTGNTEEYDSSDVFDNFGTSVISNFKLLTKVCQREQRFNRPDLITAGVESLTDPYQTVDYDDNSYDTTTTTLRSYFPETWLWELVPIGQSGNVQVDRYTPHTITNWSTNVLCISEKDGPGFDAPNDLRTFQPFFLDVILPYSIKRDEIFHMETILFNYLNYSLPVQVNLIPDNGFKMLDRNEKESGSTNCIPPNSSLINTFRIKSQQLGVLNLTVIAEIDTSFPGECGPEYIINRRDVLYKSIKVEPEGYPSEIIKSTILCTSDVHVTSNMTWNITLPDDIVKDSLKAKIILNADMMGPTLHNLDKLINMPTGCGEQIMATMAPNIYILKYLTSTKQINSKLYGRLVKNLKIGYQRILDYVHDDGSFSAFGYHDRNGSMFLTSFVIRTLNVAKSYIYVDKLVIKRAFDWIISNQLENGCFPAVSHVFQYMGGTSFENSTASLTSYVMLSLLESKLDVPEKIITNAKYCIRANQQPDKYTLAISIYALYLLDWQIEADRNLQKLLDLATREGELLWWSDSGGSSSLNIEMTSYALMSLLYKNITHNLIYANSVVKWLSTQRRSFGSFVSTQDTAVALDAISRYAAKMKTRYSNLNVNIVADGDNYNVQIKNTDKLKNVEVALHGSQTNINVNINGKGCLLAQVVYNFNLKELANSEAFKLRVDMNPVSTIDKCSIAIVTPCISYIGHDLRSNMAVLEVAMPSGYEADIETLYKLLDESNVTKLKRFEENDNKVILYFVELNNEPICVPFTITEHAIVENHVDAIVNLYDYYKPEYKVSTTYKINTCQTNENQTTYISKLQSVTYVSNNDTNESVNKGTVIRERRNIDDNAKINNGLNQDFVDMDIELAVPEGDEGGNVPVYVKPNKINKASHNNNNTRTKLNAI